MGLSVNEKRITKGLLTGSAFPQGSAIIKWTLSLPEKAEGYNTLIP